MKLGCLAFAQDVLWVQDRWGDIGRKSLGWVLFEILLREYALDVLVELEVLDLEWVHVASVVVLEDLVLLGGELYLLSVEGGSELGRLNSSLSQWIVILQEFSKSDSVSHDVVLDLLDESFDGTGTGEVDVEWLIGGLSTGVRFVDDVVSVLTIVEEWHVLDITIIVSVLLDNGIELGIADLNTEESDGLFELFWGNLEVVVSIWILEEALSIKSLSSNEVSECIKNAADILFIGGIWTFCSVETLGSGSIDLNVNGSLEVFLGENFVDAVTEFSPQNMGTFLWRLESIGKSSEFFS